MALTKGTKMLIVAVVALIVVIIGMALGYNWDTVCSGCKTAAKKVGLSRVGDDAFGGRLDRLGAKADVAAPVANPAPDDDMRDARSDIRGDGQVVYDTVQPEYKAIDHGKEDLVRVDPRLDAPVYVKPAVELYKKDIDF